MGYSLARFPPPQKRSFFALESNEKIVTRLHVDEPLSKGTSVGLDHDRAHFLRTVLRLKPGALIALFNARDGEWRARIDGLGKDWCSLSVLDQSREGEETPDIWLIFAPIKRARLDFLVEKATELGCARLLPVFTRHTAVDRVNTERLRANVREAAEQCERLSLPEVSDPLALDQLLADWPEERRILYCAEAGEAQPISECLADLQPGSSWAILVGPEGGFSGEERSGLSHLSFCTAVSLGPRILRSDTAALAALACWQSALGNLHLYTLRVFRRMILKLYQWLFLARGLSQAPSSLMLPSLE